MNVIVCDRCGGTIKRNAGLAYYPTYPPAYFVIKSDDRETLDLCEECQEELDKFLLGWEITEPEGVAMRDAGGDQGEREGVPVAE